jgi:hypothetical protein
MVTSCYEATYIALAEAVAASVLLATYRGSGEAPHPLQATWPPLSVKTR